MNSSCNYISKNKHYIIPLAVLGGVSVAVVAFLLSRGGVSHFVSRGALPLSATFGTLAVLSTAGGLALFVRYQIDKRHSAGEPEPAMNPVAEPLPAEEPVHVVVPEIARVAASANETLQEVHRSLHQLSTELIFWIKTLGDTLPSFQALAAALEAHPQHQEVVDEAITHWILTSAYDGSLGAKSLIQNILSSRGWSETRTTQAMQEHIIMLGLRSQSQEHNQSPLLTNFLRHCESGASYDSCAFIPTLQPIIENMLASNVLISSERGMICNPEVEDQELEPWANELRQALLLKNIEDVHNLVLAHVRPWIAISGRLLRTGKNSLYNHIPFPWFGAFHDYQTPFCQDLFALQVDLNRVYREELKRGGRRIILIPRERGLSSHPVHIQGAALMPRSNAVTAQLGAFEQKYLVVLDLFYIPVSAPIFKVTDLAEIPNPSILSWVPDFDLSPLIQDVLVPGLFDMLQKTLPRSVLSFTGTRAEQGSQGNTLVGLILRPITALAGINENQVLEMASRLTSRMGFLFPILKMLPLLPSSQWPENSDLDFFKDAQSTLCSLRHIASELEGNPSLWSTINIPKNLVPKEARKSREKFIEWMRAEHGHLTIQANMAQSLIFDVTPSLATLSHLLEGPPRLLAPVEYRSHPVPELPVILNQLKELHLRAEAVKEKYKQFILDVPQAATYATNMFREGWGLLRATCNHPLKAKGMFSNRIRALFAYEALELSISENSSLKPLDQLIHSIQKAREAYQTCLVEPSPPMEINVTDRVPAIQRLYTTVCSCASASMIGFDIASPLHTCVSALQNSSLTSLGDQLWLMANAPRPIQLKMQQSKLYELLLTQGWGQSLKSMVFAYTIEWHHVSVAYPQGSETPFVVHPGLEELRDAWQERCVIPRVCSKAQVPILFPPPYRPILQRVLENTSLEEWPQGSIPSLLYDLICNFANPNEVAALTQAEAEINDQAFRIYMPHLARTSILLIETMIRPKTVWMTKKQIEALPQYLPAHATQSLSCYSIPFIQDILHLQSLLHHYRPGIRVIASRKGDELPNWCALGQVLTWPTLAEETGIQDAQLPHMTLPVEAPSQDRSHPSYVKKKAAYEQKCYELRLHFFKTCTKRLIELMDKRQDLSPEDKVRARIASARWSSLQLKKTTLEHQYPDLEFHLISFLHDDTKVDDLKENIASTKRFRTLIATPTNILKGALSILPDTTFKTLLIDIYDILHRSMDDGYLYDDQERKVLLAAYDKVAPALHALTQPETYTDWTVVSGLEKLQELAEQFCGSYRTCADTHKP